MVRPRVDCSREWRAPAAALTLLGLMGLAGCTGGGQGSAGAPPAPATPQPTAVAPSQPGQPAPVPASPAGLTPLATPRQVVTAIGIGRADPFAPVQLAQASGQLGPDGKPKPASGGTTLPEGFRLTGVMRTGGLAQALVQIGDQSGPLCPGPRGRCTGAGYDQPLLPAGWTVTGIDVVNGLLALSDGRQQQVIRVEP